MLIFVWFASEFPRVLQILTTEHWSLLSARALTYKEAFTRAGMFLTARASYDRALQGIDQGPPSRQPGGGTNGSN